MHGHPFVASAMSVVVVVPLLTCTCGSVGANGGLRCCGHAQGLLRFVHMSDFCVFVGGTWGRSFVFCGDVPGGVVAFVGATIAVFLRRRLFLLYLRFPSRDRVWITRRGCTTSLVSPASRPHPRTRFPPPLPPIRFHVRVAPPCVSNSRVAARVLAPALCTFPPLVFPS